MQPKRCFPNRLFGDHVILLTGTLIFRWKRSRGFVLHVVVLVIARFACGEIIWSRYSCFCTVLRLNALLTFFNVVNINIYNFLKWCCVTGTYKGDTCPGQVAISSLSFVIGPSCSLSRFIMNSALK